MARKNRQEEALLQITARYVAEVQAGKKPRLSDYLARYPQHADAISEFVTYYHAMEADVPTEPAIMPALSPVSDMALQRAWQRVSESRGAPLASTQSTHQIITLREAVQKQHFTLHQLASALDLSVDIIKKFAGISSANTHLIEPSTIPQEVFRRLARILQQPLGAIQAYFGLSEQPQAIVAETPSPYQLEQQTRPQMQSFRQALEESQELSDEQKARWLDTLEHEKL